MSNIILEKRSFARTMYVGFVVQYYGPMSYNME